MGIADHFLWPIALIAFLSPAVALQRSPRQPQLILPSGLGIGIGLQQTGQQQEPLLQTSTLLTLKSECYSFTRESECGVPEEPQYCKCAT
jgi:hypothetical protein